ncbi:MAG: hypothetical protein COB04_06915 [Gammaproteobacteria bacterium]|nr:MAG: hypothetical protein COB04_06915 [Gammaproteobacteria bacterium]
MINTHMSASNVIQHSLNITPNQNLAVLPAFITLVLTIPLILALVWSNSTSFSEARFILSDSNSADALVIDKDVKKRMNVWGTEESVYRVYLAFNTKGRSTFASYYDTTEEQYHKIPYGELEKVTYSKLSADINGRHTDLVAAASLLSVLQKTALPAIIIILGMILLFYYPSKYLIRKYLLVKP